MWRRGGWGGSLGGGFTHIPEMRLRTWREGWTSFCTLIIRLRRAWQGCLAKWTSISGLYLRFPATRDMRPCLAAFPGTNFDCTSDIPGTTVSVRYYSGACELTSGVRLWK